MKLLNKKDYKAVENLLRSYRTNDNLSDTYLKAINEIINFFNYEIYKEFLEIFYFERHQFKNRYPDNRTLFSYLSTKLFLREPTLYVIKKEIVYKSAMIFYKYRLME